MLVTAAVALIPLVYSLNRGVWVGVGLTAVYLAVRLAARGKLAMLGLVCAALAARRGRGRRHPAAGPHHVAAAASAEQCDPGVAVGHRSPGRERVAAHRVRRHPAPAGQRQFDRGRPDRQDCPTCGQYPVGSNGQLYLLLICNGWVGTVLFLSFFGYLGWRYRRDKTPYGMAGVLVILLSFLYMFAYDR